MTRSSVSERNIRINTAIKLLSQNLEQGQIVVELMNRYKVSKRQAYRYLQAAQGATHPLPLSESKIVFTVKLPKSVVQRIREFALSSGQSLSDITTDALENFLSKGEKSG
jgi:predicted DNA-binding transcriptional regulator YafY